MTQPSTCPYCGSENWNVFQDNFEQSDELILDYVDAYCKDCKRSFDLVKGVPQIQ